MGLSPAGKCSRSLLIALSVSALIHFVLLANTAFQEVLIAGESGNVPKNLQVLVKSTLSPVADSLSATKQKALPPHDLHQRMFPPAQKKAQPEPVTPEIHSTSALASTSRESMIPPASPPALVGPKKPITEDIGVGTSGGGRESAMAEMAGASSGPDEVRSYRIALASTARKFKVYPPMAREQGIGGRSEIMIILTPFGVPKVSLRTSSGEPSLDHAALDMMQRSVRVVELPFALRNQQMEFMLPVEFVPGS